MARGQVFAKSSKGNDLVLPIDHPVYIDMMIALDEGRTEASGQPTFTSSTFAVKELDAGRWSDWLGQVIKPSDQAWLERAKLTNPLASHHQFISRVCRNQVRDDETGEQGFLVEVLAGEDAEAYRRMQRLSGIEAAFRRSWWLAPIVLVLLYVIL